MISTSYRRLIIVVYTILFSICYTVWIISTVRFEKDWECVQCHGTKSNVIQQFLYFSLWSLHLTTATFIFWIFFSPKRDNNSNTSFSATREEEEKQEQQQEEAQDDDDDDDDDNNHNQTNNKSEDGKKREPLFSLSNTIYNLSLPIACDVLVGNLIYITSTPPKEFVDSDICYHVGTFFIHKDVGNDTVVNFLLTIGFISDLTIHWLSAPLLLVLVFSKEITFTGKIYYPWSTVLFVILAIIMGILQESLDVTTIYCSDNFVLALAAMCFGTLFFHILFACYFSGKYCTRCCCCSHRHRTSDYDDDEVILTSSNLMEKEGDAV